MGKAARKQNRDSRKRLKSEGKRTMREFFSHAGIAWPSNSDQIWSAIENGMGSEYTDELLTLLDKRDRGEIDPKIYEHLAKSTLSLRLTLPLLAPMSREWLSYFAALDLPDGDLLDLGCGSGFNTCFYASLRPQSRVVGVDQDPKSVVRAEEFAQELGIKNVRFVCGDICDLDLGACFAVACSTASRHEIDDLVDDEDRFSSQAAGRSLFAAGRSDLAEAAARHLEEGGFFVTLERLPNFEDLASWVGSIENAGIHVRPKEIEPLTWQGPEDVEKSFVVMARGDGPSCAYEELVDAVVDGTGAYGEFSAEISLAQSGAVSFIAGQHFEVHDEWGKGKTRLYLCFSNGRVVMYMTTSRGMRQIVRSVPPEQRAQLEDDFNEMVRSFESAPDVVASSPLTSDHMRVDLDLASV